ncbi:MAG: cyclic nucleotide-binding domain-containing protein [Pseudomonadota bacterium]
MIATLQDLTIYDVAGVLGVACYLISYFCLQMGFIRGADYLYAGLNLLASSLVLFSLVVNFNAYSAAIQISWIAISLVGIARLFLISRAVRFTPEEAAFRDAILRGMDAQNAWRLIRRGNWRNCEIGETLVEEGGRVKRLIYLAKGTADISLNGETFTQIQAPAFIGEMGVLTNLPATATATVSSSARIWELPGRSILSLLSDIELRLQLEGVLARDMRQKLVAVNNHTLSRREAR